MPPVKISNKRKQLLRSKLEVNSNHFYGSITPHVTSISDQ